VNKLDDTLKEKDSTIEESEEVDISIKIIEEEIKNDFKKKRATEELSNMRVNN